MMSLLISFLFTRIQLYNKKVKELELPLVFVPEKMPVWSTKTIKTNNFNPCPTPEDCFFCKTVGKEGICSTARVVYNFVCKSCNKIVDDTLNINNTNYIGGTTCPLRDRFNQHRYAISREDKSSALTEHILDEHYDDYVLLKEFINSPQQWDEELEEAIDQYDEKTDAYVFSFFNLEVRDICRTDAAVWVSETTHIELEDPKINRKLEQSFLFLLKKKAKILNEYLKNV